MPASAKLIEFTDRELLGILSDCADNTGHASLEAIAQKLGITHDNPVHCVRMRLTYLKRRGFVERAEDESMWALTAEGRMFFTGKLKATVARALESLSDTERSIATTLITRGYEHMGEHPAFVVRREFQHHLQRRNALRALEQ